jgi:hypothetical protein
VAGKVVDRIFPDKIAQAAEREKAQLAVLQMQQDGTLKEMQMQMSGILAEAQSTDPWTSRARPSFLYVMYLMILFGIPMGVLSIWHPEMAAAVAQGMQAWLTAIPDSLYTLFGVGYLGYAIPRSIEKIKGVK